VPCLAGRRAADAIPDALALALAAQAFRSGDDAIARVADRRGYESEAAFSRAFKREFGMPPAAWRRSGRRKNT